MTSHNHRFLALGAVAGLAATALVGCSDSGNDSATATSTSAATEASVVQLQLFGASSTRVLNDEIVEAAAKLDPPVNIEFNNDGSGSLVSQLAEGATADILITADKKNMDQAVEDGSVTNPVEAATNSMVMIVPADNPANIESLEDLTPDVNLVLCDPSVPCGTVSEQLQKANNVTLSPVSLEGAVGDVLGKVQNGEADAGWVYRTDAQAAGDDVKVIDIPHANEFPNTIWIALTVASTNPEAAQQVINLILSDEMAKHWEAAGFTPTRN